MRRLPGIVECDLWEVLEQNPGYKTMALVTDIGNDILFEVPVHVIVKTVKTCITRLQILKAQIVMTLLPVENVRTLDSLHYKIIRNLFFPFCNLSLTSVLNRVEELQSCLIELGIRYDIKIVHPKAEWYGFDHIHICKQARSKAWNEILSQWTEIENLPTVRYDSLFDRIYLNRLRPHKYWLMGLERACKQPVGILSDGSRVFKF